jgi:hypothetical protein
MINREWHEKNKMPKNPKVNQRMEWHIEHIKNCSCYPVSEKLKKEIKDYQRKK